MLDPMPKRYPHVLTEITRHGRKVFYFRRGKGPRIRLPSPGTDSYARPRQDQDAIAPHP